MQKGQPVKQLDSRTGEVLETYPSIRSAAKTFGINKELIRQVLNHPARTAKGFRWETAEFTVHSEAKILILDIEVAPSEAFVWGLWKQDIYQEQIISDWYILSWAAKWLANTEVESDVLTPYESLVEDDSRILRSLWKLMDEADIIIAHNGDKYDIPKIKTRFLLNEIDPPSFYKQIDTLKVARKEFGFSSNRLNYLAKFLGVDTKFETNFNLWKRCREGNPEALREMERYNVQDVEVLEAVYLYLRPYIKGHPNLDLYVDSEVSLCPNCGKDSLELQEGKYVYTQAVRYQMYKCSNCSAISRSKKGLPYKNKKQISAIPR